MPILLPDFTDPALREFTVCSRVDADPPPANLALESVITNELSQEVWVRLIVNEQDDPKGVHVHIDMRRASLLRELPTDLVPIEEVLSHVDQFLGKEMDASPAAEFAVPLCGCF